MHRGAARVRACVREPSGVKKWATDPRHRSIKILYPLPDEGML